VATTGLIGKIDLLHSFHYSSRFQFVNGLVRWQSSFEVCSIRTLELIVMIAVKILENVWLT